MYTEVVDAVELMEISRRSSSKNSNARTSELIATEVPGEPHGSPFDDIPVPKIVLMYAVAMTILRTRAPV